MEIYQALILGIIQGITEFLPVSSSGHLALLQHSFGITEPTLFFDICLHIGTLFAISIVFFDDIKAMIVAIINSYDHAQNYSENHSQNHSQNHSLKFVFLIIVGSVPTALIGLFLKNYADILFSSINFVGSMLLITGTFLWLTKGVQQTRCDNKKAPDIAAKEPDIVAFGYKQALFIGMCQGIAVLPGISRSGATISAGLFVGIDRETAAKFSFLMSIPAISGAAILSLKDFIGVKSASIDMAAIFYGTSIAFVVGYGALKVLLKIVRNGKLHLFAPYCWIMGVIAVISGVL